MPWDPQLVVILNKLREAYTARRRNYARALTFGGDEIVVHDRAGGRTDINLESGDYEAL